MKLLIVRHGDPDYAKDSMTEKGWREARYLSERLIKMGIDDFYVSPLGRARATASFTLDRLGQTAEVKDWLQEFPARIQEPSRPGEQKIAWDWLPEDWTKEERFYQADHWFEVENMRKGYVKELYDQVAAGLDEILARHGYVREGNYYRTDQGNTDTVALFCHFGVECVMLSHLLHISPMPLWHGSCALPSSVTTLVTEERRKGIASFRMLSFGDLSHLYVHGEVPAFAARFCEVYENENERHD
ncbi:histidine phosphatase family protein [Oscillospiraceae bacterium NTUH-002-81]|nr:histidine phosphatase family protein [Oscillospiraceae bacterium NTUH-002-81]